MSDDPNIDHIADKLDDGRTLYAHESRALLERVRELEGANERLRKRLLSIQQARRVGEFDPEGRIEEMRKTKDEIKEEISDFLKRVENADE